MDKYYRSGQKVKGEYTIINEIGEGRYGIAYLAKDDNDKRVVVKQLKKDMLRETRRKLFYEEMILESLNSPAFPNFIGKFKDRYREGYILEYIEGRDFEDLVIKDGIRFTKEDIYRIAGQLLDLMEILHDNNIVHRDIRLPNVIVKDNMELALIDFGLARFIDGREYVPQMDYWYLGDFLIHLYYANYGITNVAERAWYEELELSTNEKRFLKRLMGIGDKYYNIYQISEHLRKIIREYNYRK